MEKIPWEALDHFSLVLTLLVAPLIWVIQRVLRLVRSIEGDRKKLAALWREHGYENWDGEERRLRMR